jgi:hypothetical protein
MTYYDNCAADKDANKGLYLRMPYEEAGKNNTTVTLRITGGDEKGTRAWGYNWATLALRRH